jgi:hypothetical protein
MVEAVAADGTPEPSERPLSWRSYDQEILVPAGRMDQHLAGPSEHGDPGYSNVVRDSAHGLGEGTLDRDEGVSFARCCEVLISRDGSMGGPNIGHPIDVVRTRSRSYGAAKARTASSSRCISRACATAVRIARRPTGRSSTPTTTHADLAIWPPSVGFVLAPRFPSPRRFRSAASTGRKGPSARRAAALRPAGVRDRRSCPLPGDVSR